MDRMLEGKLAALEIAVAYALAIASKQNPDTDLVAGFVQQTYVMDESLSQRASDLQMTRMEASDLAAGFSGTLKDIQRLAEKIKADLP